MDPNETLKRIAELLALLESRVPSNADRHEYLAEADDLREDLDNWLHAGGFEPNWQEFPSAAEHYAARFRRDYETWTSAKLRPVTPLKPFDLPLEACKLVLAIRDRMGKNYKRAISLAWQDGNYTKHGLLAEESSLLQSIRNAFGPCWLADFSPATAKKIVEERTTMIKKASK